MSEKGIFNVDARVTDEQIGLALLSYLQKRGLEAEGYGDGESYYIQARSPQNALKKIAGLSSAMVASIKTNQGGQVAVEIGAGEWAGKVGATIGASIVLPPLAFIPAYGEIRQAMLHKEALSFVKEYCKHAQPESVIHDTNDNYAPELETVVSLQDENDQRIVCDVCGASNITGYKFCIDCGSELLDKNTCPSCGVKVSSDMKFCANCGQKIPQGNECPKCGTELQDGQRFCHECGTDTQA